MLFETAISAPDGSLAKIQFGLEDVRRHQADPTTGRSVLSLRSSSQFASPGNTPTWEAYGVLSARLATLSASKPVALMSEDDWDAAQAAHG
jgi:hypothetical protein